MSSITTKLFKAARLSADLRAISSGSPAKIANRGKNKMIGRAAARSGIWSKLWKAWF